MKRPFTIVVRKHPIADLLCADILRPANFVGEGDEERRVIFAGHADLAGFREPDSLVARLARMWPSRAEDFADHLAPPFIYPLRIEVDEPPFNGEPVEMIPAGSPPVTISDRQMTADQKAKLAAALAEPPLEHVVVKPVPFGAAALPDRLEVNGVPYVRAKEERRVHWLDLCDVFDAYSRRALHAVRTASPTSDVVNDPTSALVACNEALRVELGRLGIADRIIFDIPKPLPAAPGNPVK